MKRLAKLVHETAGIVVRDTQHDGLRSALVRASGTDDPDVFQALIADPAARGRLVDRLVEEVVVGETFFLRDREQLEAIDWRALHAGAAGGVVRVWSAGCSTGDEPYSLALLAAEAFAPAPPPVEILGTDISRPALEAARRGRYRPRALREVEPSLRARYFREQGGETVVGDRLRALVSFARHNLTRDPIPPLGWPRPDLIVCRNILIYFDAQTAQRVSAALEQALRPGGVCLLGVADALCVTTPRLARRAEATRARAPVPAARARPQPPSRAAATARRPPAPAELPAPRAEAELGRGLAALEAGRSGEAIAALRRALYLDPDLALAAFALGRAHDASGDVDAAARAYDRALRTIELAPARNEALLDQVPLGDLAAACRLRLAALR